LVGSALERLHDFRSGELFGGGVQPVGIALNSIMEPDRRVAEFTEQSGGGDGSFVAGEDLLQRLGRRVR
jgi:hypothetical protein